MIFFFYSYNNYLLVCAHPQSFVGEKNSSDQVMYDIDESRVDDEDVDFWISLDLRCGVVWIHDDA